MSNPEEQLGKHVLKNAINSAIFWSNFKNDQKSIVDSPVYDFNIALEIINVYEELGGTVEIEEWTKPPTSA